ncbi:UNKNOWN [Stylonychia lemnae]|uniref:Uncharacterized protein n=1 Tax=Stylonychia lemnae TaxID=5949 RepID=A0A077ZR15_STYLE|nr:UNKNOWN [Stylonychia lemnae]|eukprot:CDW71894.1 UNKNOWN [Stylonychia lemnae]
MEDLDQFKGQFEFLTRRAITEAAPHRAACRYDSADDNEEEELAINGADYFDLNMLPDQMPQDLYAQNTQPLNLIPQRPYKDGEIKNYKGLRASAQGKRENYALGKPLKPTTFGNNNNLPGKVFSNCASSGYNSQKNLRNNQTMNGCALGNNRYSSQNNKGFDCEDEDELMDDGEGVLDVAEENCIGATVLGSQLQTEAVFTESAPETLSQTYRRGSYRYKDRINTLRMQSKENYQREHMIGPTYFTEIDEKGKNEEACQDDEFELFDRAQHDNILSQRMRQHETQINVDFSDLEIGGQQTLFKSRYTIEKAKYDKRWTTQPADQNDVQVCDDDEDNTPKQDLSQQFLDPRNGAHFQYKELIKRLSDITNSSREKNSSRKGKNTRPKVKQCETDARLPLKEKTQEIMNQIDKNSSSKKKRVSAQGDHSNKGKPFSNSAKNSKKQDTKKIQEQITVKVPMHQIPQNLITQNKISKLLLSNQENHFIDKKLKDLQMDSGVNISKSNIAKNLTINHNKSHQNLHKSIEKTFNKISTQQQCQINNMKLNKASGQQNKLFSNAPIQNQAINKHQSQNQIVISNILSNNALSSSISSSSTGGPQQIYQNGQQQNNCISGTFNTGTKCPSTNFLKTATTAFTTTTTNKSSAKLTQCNSNKQINNNKETPEATTRQKLRLTGTALSSTSKRNNMNSAGCGTTLSNNSQGNTIQNSQTNIQGLPQHQFGYHDSGNKRSHNSEQKDSQNIANKSHQALNPTSGTLNSGTNTHPSSVPRSNSSHKKVQQKQVQKMIKNQSFLKGSQIDNVNKKQNEFYNTIYQNIQTGKLGLSTLSGGSQLNLNLKNNQQQMQLQQQSMVNFQNQNIQGGATRLSDNKKNSIVGNSSKTTRVQAPQNQIQPPSSSKPQSRLSQGKTPQNDGLMLENANFQAITKSMKRISEMMHAQQQSPTNNNNDTYSRKSSNKNFKDEQNNNEKSLVGKNSSINLFNIPALNAQKINQFFMKINQEQQQYLANQSQVKLAQHSQQQQQPQMQTSSISQQNQNNFQSILLNHQVQKKNHANNTSQQQNQGKTQNRPLSGNDTINQPNQNVYSEATNHRRKISQEKQNMAQSVLQQSDQNQKQNNIDFDNRQSLQVQHKTMEKKQTTTSQQQQKMRNLHEEKEKMNRYLAQKKEELAQATLKSNNQRYAGQDQSVLGKKGFLLANIKIPKSNANQNNKLSNNQHSQQQLFNPDVYERMHMPTEEDDYSSKLMSKEQLFTEVYQLGNIIETDGDQIQSFSDIGQYLQQQQQQLNHQQQNYHHHHQNQKVQPKQHISNSTGAQRHSVKVKPKNV